MGLKRIAQYGLMTFLACSLSVGSVAWAEEEEHLVSSKLTLEAFIHTLDPAVKVREDSLVTFSDGSQYVLIRPEEPAYPEQLDVLKRLPEGSEPSDIIVFNNGAYLLRILTLPTGQKTFPVLPEVPDELKTGLLAQNLTFPEGFFLPTQWKALTGNLLVSPGTGHHESAKPTPPLVVYSPDPHHLAFWNPATAEVVREISLSCEPSALVASGDGHTLWVGCPEEKKLYEYALNDGKDTAIELSEPVLSLALDARQHRLFISHPGKHVISVLDTKTHALLPKVTLPYDAGMLVVSPMRSKLFSTVPSPKKYGDEDPFPVVHTALGRFFRHPSRLDEMQAAKEAAQPQRIPVLQILNTATLELERITPALEGVNQIYNQDEKLLWTYSPQAKALQAFDMRWQEFSEPVPLEEAPLDFASDGTWLYMLLPQQNVLARLNTKTMMWGAPIALEPGSTPQSLVYDPQDNQALVLANHPDGIQVINLNRGEWVGTQQTAFAGAGKMHRIGESHLTANEQVRIKFQNGRVLRQTVQGIQWEKWLSAPHAPQNSQTQPEPSETPSVP